MTTTMMVMVMMTTIMMAMMLMIVMVMMTAVVVMMAVIARTMVTTTSMATMVAMAMLAMVMTVAMRAHLTLFGKSGRRRRHSSSLLFQPPCGHRGSHGLSAPPPLAPRARARAPFPAFCMLCVYIDVVVLLDNARFSCSAT